MGNNLPPGVSPFDKDAPWNEPEPEDERRDRLTHKECGVCSPPPDIHERVKYDRPIPFCDRHSRSDFRALLRAEAERFEEDDAERYRKR